MQDVSCKPNLMPHRIFVWCLQNSILAFHLKVLNFFKLHKCGFPDSIDLHYTSKRLNLWQRTVDKFVSQNKVNTKVKIT